MSASSLPAPPVVVIGGSAGALEPLREVVAQLPADFPAAVLIALHSPPDLPSYLAPILRSLSALPVSQARQGEALLAGHIYTAAPNRHLLVSQTQVRLGFGPRENRSRPSIDVLFRSAAYTHRAGVIGVLLSGMLDDGTSGLWTLKRLGGQAIVQHPEEAQYPSMPLAALRNIDVDAILPAHEIAARLRQILVAPDFGLSSVKRRPESTQQQAQNQAGDGQEGDSQEGDDMNERELYRLELEVSVAEGINAFEAGLLNEGEFSAFTCPECHGVMIKLREGAALRFRCHTGHAYTTEALLSELRQAAEISLWNAVRGMEEHAMLLAHMAKHSAEACLDADAELYRREAEEVRDQIEPLRRAIARQGELSPLFQARPLGPANSAP